MVGPAFDCFSNPLGAVRLAFDKACSSHPSPPADFGRTDWGVQELFRQAVLDSGSLPQVPEINSVPLDAIPVNSLLRFRGMIQDMFNIEYYIGAFKDGATWRTNKYTDVAVLPVCAEADMQIWDRRPLYCVPVPGENLWVKDVFVTRGFQIPQARMPLDARQTVKRNREACSSFDNEDMETDDSEQRGLKEAKRMCNGTNPCTDPNPPADAYDLNMPLGEENLLPCLVKVYDGCDADLKLNDIVEFIGVLTFDPDLSIPRETGCESLDTLHPSLEDDISTYLPASKVPRLHCIFHRKLSGHKLFSTMPDFDSDWTRVNASSPSFKELRRALLEGLTIVLGGDYLAAEYLLLHLLSQVHARVEPMAVGKLSLNLTDSFGRKDGAPLLLASTIAQTIAALLPRSHFMPLSLEYLNGAPIAPRKDYISNRLMTGALQLADGTHLTLDETALKTGQLMETGLQNVHFLKNLIEWQKVEYDFEYYKMEMPTDVPVLVLSTARSRLFPADVVVPLRPTMDSSQMNLDQAALLNWRMYLSAARAAEHTIEPSMQKTLEEHLVRARQEDRLLGPDVFHRWLTLARLLSVSFGESTLSLERWEMVMELEKRRCERHGCSN